MRGEHAELKMQLRKAQPIKWICILASAGLVAACASARKVTDPASAAPAVAAEGEEAGPPVSKEEISSKEIEANVERSYRSEYGEVNLKVNSLVEKWIGYFQGRGRHWMELYLSRSTRYMPMMKNTLREYGLPEDLVYVAMIESGFSPVAHSRAAAVGYWQFVRATARTYGLTVNRYIDERRDPVLSTRAAAEYFKALYNLFGSWHLALASYNSGENRVKSVVMKNFTRDFWELVRLRKIPPETQNYVPKFIAAAIIAKDPSHYGFTNIEYEPSLDYDTIAVPNAISLRKLSQNIDVDYDDLRLLNPKYRSDYVPVYPHVETVLRVPTGMKDKALASLETAVSGPPKMLLADAEFYKVKRGDSLSTIAARNGTSISTLQRLNNLRTHQLLRIGQLLKVPEGRGSEDLDLINERRQPSARTATAISEVDGPAPMFHVVRHGEKLASIARLYNTTIKELRRLNRLDRRAKIHEGDRLIIRQSTDKVEMNQIPKKNSQIVINKVSPRFHVVRKGDTLTRIAKKYKVSLSQLLAVNDLGRRQALVAGRFLVIPK
jgi:membrane-bound lytic murein transglycosylase D